MCPEIMQVITHNPLSHSNEAWFHDIPPNPEYQSQTMFTSLYFMYKSVSVTSTCPPHHLHFFFALCRLGAVTFTLPGMLRDISISCNHTHMLNRNQEQNANMKKGNNSKIRQGRVTVLAHCTSTQWDLSICKDSCWYLLKFQSYVLDKMWTDAQTYKWVYGRTKRDYMLPHGT